ncbi:MAG: DNA mismatch repair protein MutT [Candidatus Fermentithermobacillus carboniphilus]|uniref:DNA mismatch repair protein MutT n=1 Tax=Candidatus Fermentithermobacillus carboniphilus TaxID=3085328 RepID=A0AAT9L9C2_9FIRM|nr:MAG: DNA mismatch repair protein MutT [Candidatus Fermentithermobacillus carboniphilus]
MAVPDAYPQESVLCVPTQDLYAKVGKWRGLRKPTSDIWQVIAKKSCFKPRATVETDPAYKQLISYTMFLSDKRIFVMKRLEGQGEKRLRGLLSVGVGGHMNPVKDIQWPGKRRLADLKSLVGMNTVREIREEVALAGNPPVGVVGFLNDDENEVGRVHLGVVSVVHLPSPLLAVKENDKMMGAWVEFDKLHVLGQFETWSSLVLEGLV